MSISSIKKLFLSTEYVALLLIVAVGAFLRLYNLEGLSLSNDELSALTRTKYPNFCQMIQYGVIFHDTHPAGIETFLYFYTKCFGQDEFTLRLPFAICGILTIPVCFFLFKKWFGIFTALFTSASIALLQYPIFYSQLARPYIPGLLFSLLLLFCWTNLYFEEKHKKLFWYGGYILLSSICAYTHYICLLFAGLLWFCSFFYISKKYIKLHITVAFIAIALYIPHLWIFISQLKKGGLTWLGKPGWDYLAKYIFYIFNESWLVLGFAVLLIISFSIYVYHKKWFRRNKFRGFALLMFGLLFLITFLKSYFGKPVLQYSTLIFVAPLLIAFLFSILDNIKISDRLKYFLLLQWCTLCIFNLFYEKNYYTKEHYPQFKPLAKKGIAWNKTFGSNNITFVYNSYAPYYFRYYLPEAADTANAIFYKINSQSALDSLFKTVKRSKTQYFAYGWSNISNFPEAEKVINLKYNSLVAEDLHFQSEIKLFEKTADNISPKLELRDSASNNLFEIPYKQALKNALIRVETEVNLSELNPEIDIVASVENQGKVIFWKTSRVADYFETNERKAKIVWFTQLPENASPNDLLKIYIWNRSNAQMQVRNFVVQFY